MTSASNSGNYVDFDEYIGLKLEKTRSTIRTTDVLTALAGIAAVFLSYLLVFVIFDQWVLTHGFSPFWRWVLLSTLMLSTAAWLIWKVAMPSVRSVNGLFAAREIEKAEPGLKSSLLNLVDLKGAGRTVNPTILKALERQAALKLQKIDVGQSIDHRPLIRTAYALLIVIVVFCFYAMLSPKKISNSIWRGLMPGSGVGVATITEIIDVKPGDKTIPAHEQSVDIQVDIAGEIPPHVTLLYTTSDGKQDQPVELHVEQEGQTRYRGQLIGEGTQGLIHDISYYIRAGDATSRQFKITVEQPPYADVEMVRVEHPGYMKIAPFDQPNNPGIDAWEGAKVIVSAKANMPLRSAKIQFLDDAQSGPNGEEELMSISGGGRQLQAAWTLRRRADGTQPKLYRIDCRTDDDRVTVGHVNYPINIKPDLPPEIVLIHPDRDLSVAANATVPLAIQARDPDFELSYVYLNVEKSGQKIFREPLSEGRQQKLTIKSELPMTRLNPAVGDTFEIWVEAFDNKQPTPNSRATQKIKISILPPMTPKEADRELTEQKNQIEDKIAEADKNLNQEQRDAAQQPDDGDQKRENPNEVAAKDNEQQQNPNQQDQNPQDQNPQDSDQQQAGKGQSGAAKPGDKSNASEERGQGKDGEQSQKRDASKNQGDEKQSLKNDGSQDDEAMRRINQSLNEKKSSKPKDSNESEGQEQKSGDQKGEQKKPTNDPNQTGSDEAKPSESQTGDQNKSKDRNAAGDRNKDEKGANKQPKADPSKDDQQSQQPSDKPKDQSEGTNEKDSAAENQPNKKSTESQKGTEKPKPSDSDSKEDSSDAAAADGKDRQEQDPDKKSDETEQGSKPDSKQNQKGSGKDSKNNDQKQGQDAGQSDQSDAQSQQDDGDQKDGKAEQAGDKQKPSNDKSGKSKSGKDNPKEAQDATNDSDDSDSEPTGEKKQTDDSKKAKKGKADGTEKGTAKPDRDPNSKPERTKNENVKRDPKEKPEIRPDSDSSDSDNEPESSDDQADQGSKDQKSKPKQGKKGADRNQPDSPQEKKSGKPDKSQSNSDQADEVGEKPSGEGDSASEKSDDNSGSDSDQAGDGKGDKSDASKKSGESGDQKSDSNKSQKGQSSKSKEKSDGKDAKENAGADQSPEKGQKKDQQKGDSQQKGQKESKGDQQSGDKGGEKQSDAKGGKQSDKPSDQGGDQSGSKGEDGQSGKPGADGESGKQSGKAGNSDGQSKPTGTGGTNAKDGDGTSGTADGASSPQGDDPNLEYNRQATELILDKLKQDLERGDVDPELLEQLGWTEKELKQFSERMSKSLNESKRGGDTPESQARQLQFQEMLKNLDLQKSGSQRSGEKEPKRDVQQIGPKSTPIPPAYKSAFNKFTKDRARQKPPADQPKK